MTPMGLLSIALSNNSGIDVIERLAALQEKAMLRDAEMQFNEAMNAAQAEIGRIAPDANNPQTKSRYATYAKLDAVLRPIYIKHGFSLSFDSGDSAPETVIAYCYVSHRAGHTRKYQSPPMPADGKGAKGGDVMTKTHARGSAGSYGMRYLLKMIFNIAIGEDKDGNAPAPQGPITEAEVKELQTMMDAIGADAAKVLAFVSKKAGEDIKKLADIPAAQFQPLKLSLANWANRK